MFSSKIRLTKKSNKYLYFIHIEYNNMIKYSKENLKGLIEPYLYQQLDQVDYLLENLDPYELISKSRFDLNAKLLFLDGFNRNNYDYEDLYYSFINAFTLGTFNEPGNINKNNFEIFKETFKDIFNSINNEEFNNNKSIIPISREGIILNGSHRLAAAINLKKRVTCIRLNIKAPCYDFKFFKNRQVSNDFLDQCAMKQIMISQDIFTAIIWPSGTKAKVIIEDIIPNIFYKKDLKISLNGLRNFISIVYENETWIGSLEDGYSGSLLKALPCYSDSPISLVLFKPYKSKDLSIIKSKFRQIAGIGKSSIHINDSHEEAVRICNTFLNKNTMHFLDKVKPIKGKSFYINFKKFKNFISNYKLDKNLIALDGSMILSAYGLRDARDIDYVAHSSIQKELNDNDDSLISLHNNKVRNYYRKNLDDLINDSRNYFLYEDIKFISLKQLKIMKLLRKEKKDLVDIRLINTILDLNIFNYMFARLNQFLFFNILRIKKYLIIFLRKLNLFKTFRRFYYFLFRKES